MALMPGYERAVRDRLDELAGTSGLSAHETADMRGNIGVALTGMRAHREAHAAIADAVAISRRCSPLLLVAYQVWQVEAALVAGDPLMAAEHMTELAGTAPLVSSARVNSHIDGVLTMSGRWAHVPEMRLAREHLASVQP
jgi:hypothetical protein